MTQQEFEKEFVNKIVCGDAMSVLRQMPNGVINCCISSPPYWALRDYGVEGQLGLEPTFDEYIDKLCIIYDEVKRVLRPDGMCWVNLGDTYWGGKGQSGNTADDPDARRAEGNTFQRQEYKLQTMLRPQDVCGAYPAKSLCLIPHRFAIEMVNRGWVLRNVIIWSKPNPMPSSAKDRFTVDFEYVFFFCKSKRYFFEPQYEPLLESSVERDKYGYGSAKNKRIKETVNPTYIYGDAGKCNPLGRNKRTTWIIPTQPTPEAHFATFPEELVRPMVKAGCPRYVCKKCGKGREKVYERDHATPIMRDGEWEAEAQAKGVIGTDGRAGRCRVGLDRKPPEEKQNRSLFKGYTDCGCNVGFRPGIVLDPFVERAEPARSRPRKGWTIAA